MTFLILKNFVIHMMDRFQNEADKFDLPLRITTKNMHNFAGSGAASRFENQDGILINSQDNNDSLKYGLRANEAKHSGFAFSLRNGEPLTVKMNSTTSEAVRLKNSSIKPASIMDSFDSSDSEIILEKERLKRTITNKKVNFTLRRTMSTERINLIDNRIVKPIESDYANTLGQEFISSLPAA